MQWRNCYLSRPVQQRVILESCVESINNLNINKEAIETIFVDDCSSDQSQK